MWWGGGRERQLSGKGPFSGSFTANLSLKPTLALTKWEERTDPRQVILGLPHVGSDTWVGTHTSK